MPTLYQPLLFSSVNQNGEEEMIDGGVFDRVECDVGIQSHLLRI